MGGIFGKSSKKQPSRVTEQDKAVLQLKQQRDKIKQYQKRIEQSLEKDRALAIQCLNKGQRERAKLILRKKKYQENLLATTDKELETLEKLTSDLEFSQVQQQVIEGLKVGNEALKKIHEVLTIEEVERIMDESREGVEKQQEIDALIASGILSSEDEDAVAAELEELVASTLPAIDEDIDEKLPEVPSEEPEIEKKKKKEKERHQEERVALEA